MARDGGRLGGGRPGIVPLGDGCGPRGAAGGALSAAGTGPCLRAGALLSFGREGAGPPAPEGGAADVSSTYTLDNQWEKAGRRLQLLEGMLDGATTRHLSALGVGAGWRCLEVAGGAGSIARWLSDRVGPDGSVTAVDLEPRFLAEAARPNLEVHQLDVVTDPLPGTGYDLIHVRALLMHLAARDEVLAKLVAHLRPGGRLLVEEGDLLVLGITGPPAWRELWPAVCKAVEPFGSDWYWARALPESVAAAGGTAIGAACETPIFNGGSEGAEFWDLTTEQLTPLALGAGIGLDLINAVRAELTDPDTWFYNFSLISVWGRG